MKSELTHGVAEVQGSIEEILVKYENMVSSKYLYYVLFGGTIFLINI